MKKNRNLKTYDEWLSLVKDRTFRVRVYRRVGDWTPKELQDIDPNQSHYVGGDAFILCTIDDAITMPDGNILLGIRYLDADTHEPVNFIEYHTMDEISLVQVDEDNV